MKVVYVSIGNSDDKLTQARWHEFYATVDVLIRNFSKGIHGAWSSQPTSPWQNACWAFIQPTDQVSVEHLKMRLAEVAGEFDQDSIAWAEAPATEFIPGG